MRETVCMSLGNRAAAAAGHRAEQLPEAVCFVPHIHTLLPGLRPSAMQPPFAYTVRCLTCAPVLLIVVVVAVLAHAFDDPYKVLQVSRSASISEIKSSYKELARKW